jgi:hypothetical protein
MAIRYYLGKDGTVVKEKLSVPEPKKLSKAGEWIKANPNGIGLVIHDMRAVMR